MIKEKEFFNRELNRETVFHKCEFATHKALIRSYRNAVITEETEHGFLYHYKESKDKWLYEVSEQRLVVREKSYYLGYELSIIRTIGMPFHEFLAKTQSDVLSIVFNVTENSFWWRANIAKADCERCVYTELSW